MLPNDLLESAESLLELCKTHGHVLALAESCTGGLIAGCLTEIAGSSAVIDRGFVTYTNAAKAEMLGIDPALIEREGAVSEAVARAMVTGALERSNASIVVAVTGVAGPGGGSEDKPVGTVHLAAATRWGVTHHEKHKFPGNRDQVRGLTVAMALSLVEALVLRHAEAADA